MLEIGGGVGVAGQGCEENTANPSKPPHQPKPKGVQVRRSPGMPLLAVTIEFWVKLGLDW